MLVYAPAKLCDGVLEAAKRCAARTFHDLTVWSLAIMKAMCKPWEQAIRAQDRAKIESEVPYIL